MSGFGTNPREKRLKASFSSMWCSVLSFVKIFAIAGLLALLQNAAVAQIAVPVPGATPPASDRPVDPNAPIDPARPPMTPSQLVGKSLRDASKGDLEKAAHDDVEALRRGPLLIHGNYCGIGNRPGTAPVDALDAACMRHDACTPTGGLPSCACDQRFRVEATAVADDPATPPDLKITAGAAAAAIAVLVCPAAAP